MLSDVIVEDIVGLCTGSTYKKAMVYYSILLFCDNMYKEYCDNVVI